MSLQSESRNVLESLERLQGHLAEGGTSEHDLSSLMYLLNSPLFNQLLGIQDSIHQLNQWQTQRSLGPDDFEIDPESGRLTVQPQDDEAPSVHEGFDTIGTISSVESVPTKSSPKPADYTTLEKIVRQAADGRETHTVSLHKAENCSLGFSVVGLRSQNKEELGIFVQEIQPDGLAARDGQLQQDDQILAINEHVLDASISHQQTIRILQQATGDVVLVVARGPVPSKVAVDTSLLSQSERTPSAISDSSSDMVLSTEWTQLEVIDLMNDGTGLGFGIIGGKSTGVVVKTILPGGVADREGRLHSGDHLMQIGDVNVRGMGSEQVASVLRQSGAHVRLIVARNVQDPTVIEQLPHAPIVPTHQLDAHLHHFNMDLMGMEPVEGYPEEYIAQMQAKGEMLMNMDSQLPPQYNTVVNSVAHCPGSNDQEVEMFDVDLVKGTQGLGITIAGYIGDLSKDELSGIFVRSIADLSATAIDGRVQVNDQIVEVDGQSLEGFTNQQAVEVLRNTAQVVHLKLARYKHGTKYNQLQQFAMQDLESDLEEKTAAPPVIQEQLHLEDINFNQLDDDYSSELSPKVESALQTYWQPQVGDEYEVVVAQLSKFREGGGLGISLEGTVDVENGVEVRPHHYIRSVLPEGPVGLNGRLTSGDELLEVNGKRLLGLNHVEVVTILKELPQHVRIVCARKLAQSSPDAAYASQPPLNTSSDGVTNSDILHQSSDDNSQLLQSSASSQLVAPGSHSGTSEGEQSPQIDRLYKAKSDQVLPISAQEVDGASLNKGKSRSLELSGLAMWSSEPETIELEKGDKGLGFSILDYQDPINPLETVIVIRSLVPGGVAQVDGRLVPGDRLVFVNDVNLENAMLEEAVQALKGAPKGMVRVGVAKPLPLPEIGESSTDPDDVMLDEANGKTADMNMQSLELSSESPPHSPPPLPPAEISEQLDLMQTDASFKLSSSQSESRLSKPALPRKPTHVLYAGKSTSKEETINPSTEKSDEPTKPLTLEPLSLVPEMKMTLLSTDSDLSPQAASESSSSHSPHSLSPKNKPISPRGRFGGLISPSSPPSPAKKLQFSVATANEENSSNNNTSATSQVLGSKTSPDKIPPKPVIPPKPRRLSPSKLSPGKMKEQKDSPSDIVHKSPVSNAQQTNALGGSDSPPPYLPPTPVNTSDLKSFTLGTISSTTAVPSSASPSLSPASPRSAGVLGIRSLPSSLEKTIKVKKGSDQLGITVDAVDQGINGCLVKTVTESGAIAKDGRIAVGDYLVSVNNESMRRITSAQSRAILRRANLLSTDISITYIPQSDAVSYQNLSEVGVSRDPASPPTSTSSLSPNSSLHQPSSPSLSQQGGSDVEGSRSAPMGHISPMSDSSLHSQPTNSTLGATSYQSSTTTSSSAHPVAKSWGKARTVEIHRPEKAGLGISIVGGRVDLFNVSPDTQRSISGIFIKNVLEGSPAGQNGTLKTGDRILEVDGVDLREATHDAAVEAIRNARNPVQFLVQSLIDPHWNTGQSQGETASKSCDLNKTTSLPLPLQGEDEYGYSIEKLIKSYGELPGTLHLVELEKSASMGLRLSGNRDLGTMSVFVCAIKPDSISAKDGRIWVGDELLEINGQTLFGRSHLNASAIIKGIQSPTVKLVLLRREDPKNHMAVKPDINANIQYKEDPGTIIPKVLEVAPDSVTSTTSSAESQPKDSNTGELANNFPHAKHVTLKRSSQGLGLAIQSSSTIGKEGIYVKTVSPSGPAGECGEIKVGDQLLSVQEQSLLGVSYDKAIELIRSCRGEVRLVINQIGDRSSGKASTENNITKPVHNGVSEKSIEDDSAKTVTEGQSQKSEKSGDTTKPVSTESHSQKQQPIPTISEPAPPQSPPPPPPPPVQLEDPATAAITPGKETTIQIEKGKSGLGLSIVGGADTQLGAIIIHEVYEDGAAAKDGRLWAGDQICEVCGEDLRDATHERAIQVLRQTPATVVMTVYRDETMLKDEDIYDIFNVELMKKPNKGLGLSIVGRRNDTGVFISDIVKGGVAEADNHLRTGDQILSVNGEDLREATQEHAAALLKTLMGKVTLTIGRLKGSSTSSSRRNSSLTGSDRGMKKSESNLGNTKGKGKHNKIESPSQHYVGDQGVTLLSYTPKGTSGSSSVSGMREVELERDADGSLGLSITGGKGFSLGDMPILVASMSPWGPAARSNQIKARDQIVAINQQSTSDMTQQEAAQLLTGSQGPVTLQLLQGEDLVLSDEEPKHAQQPSVSSEPGTPLSGKSQIIHLEKGIDGLGFTIVGGHGSPHGDLPIYVKNVFDTGAAAKQGDLKRGHQILSVNGQSLEGARHEDAVKLLKQLQGKIELEVLQ